MSHFTVLVIGPAFEKQLAPFHEFECTGCNDEYVQDIDITADIEKEMDEGKTLVDALSYHGLDERTVETLDQVDTSSTHKYGYAQVKEGKLVKAVNRTNPNRKWDWYEVGGRWTGFFKLKSGAEGEVGTPGLMTPTPGEGYADQVLKKDVDFDGMRDEAEEEARIGYRLFSSLFPNNEIPKIGITWKEVLDGPDFKDESIEKKREIYWGQPAMKMVQTAKERTDLTKEQKDLVIWSNLEEFQVTEDEYATQARNRAVSTFAVVANGKWYEKGKMGWWGMVADAVEEEKWLTELSNMLDDLPPETMLTLVDCHI